MGLTVVGRLNRAERDAVDTCSLLGLGVGLKTELVNLGSKTSLGAEPLTQMSTELTVKVSDAAVAGSFEISPVPVICTRRRKVSEYGNKQTGETEITALELMSD